MAKAPIAPVNDRLAVEWLPLDRLTPYARNPRKNDAAVAKVAASLTEYGWRQPIVVDRDHVVVAGHTRLLAARSLGMQQVPVHVAHDLTPQQAKAYRLADNRVAQEAEWDADLLGLELTDLRIDGVDLALTGFDDKELDRLLNGAEAGGAGGGQLGGVRFQLIVECDSEQHQGQLLEELEARGLTCRPLML